MKDKSIGNLEIKVTTLESRLNKAEILIVQLAKLLTSSLGIENVSKIITAFEKVEEKDS